MLSAHTDVNLARRYTDQLDCGDHFTVCLANHVVHLKHTRFLIEKFKKSQRKRTIKYTVYHVND